MKLDIEKKIIEIISTICNESIKKDELQGEFLKTVGIKSIQIILFLTEIEKEFDVSFGDKLEDYESLKTFDSFTDNIIAKIEQKKA